MQFLRGKSRIRMKYATRFSGTKLEINDEIVRQTQNGEKRIKLVQVAFELQKGDKIYRKGDLVETKLSNP